MIGGNVGDHRLPHIVAVGEQKLVAVLRTVPPEHNGRVIERCENRLDSGMRGIKISHGTAVYQLGVGEGPLEPPGATLTVKNRGGPVPGIVVLRTGGQTHHEDLVAFPVRPQITHRGSELLTGRIPYPLLHPPTLITVNQIHTTIPGRYHRFLTRKIGVYLSHRHPVNRIGSLEGHLAFPDRVSGRSCGFPGFGRSLPI